MVVEELVIDELAAGSEEINDIHPGFNKLGVLYGYLSLSNIIVPSGLLCCLRHCMWVCGFADVNNMVQHKRRGGETFVHAMYVICNLHVIRLGSEANHMCVFRLDTISSSQQPVPIQYKKHYCSGNDIQQG